MPDPHDRRSALALSDAGGHGRVARVGLASAIVGQLIIAAAEVIWPSNRDLGDVLFSVSPILTGAGLVTAGVAIIRAGVWARPSRFLPLTLVDLPNCSRFAGESSGRVCVSKDGGRSFPQSLRRGCLERSFRNGVVSRRSRSWNQCAAAGWAAGHEESGKALVRD